MDKNIKEIKYGLIVVDPTQEGDMLDIIHFVGYSSKPTSIDVQKLREELINNKEFGLTEIAHRLNITPASECIVNEFLKNI